MTEPLTTQTPAAIDGQIFANLQEAWAAEAQSERHLLSLHNLVGDKKVYGWGRGERQGRWQFSAAEVLDKAAEIVARQVNDRFHVEITEQLQAYRTQLDSITALGEANRILEAEYTRRGGWTRAYLVDNANGHVHNNTRCSSWNRGFSATQFHWLTELSGQDENEIVALAGERACTICYPHAPVSVLASTSHLEGPNQAAARQASEERAAAKAARDAGKAAKSITNPDGSRLRGEYGTIATVVSAWRELVDNVFYHRAFNYDNKIEINNRIIAALAAKLDTTIEDITAQVETKVAAKAKREKVTLS